MRDHGERQGYFPRCHRRDLRAHPPACPANPRRRREGEGFRMLRRPMDLAFKVRGAFANLLLRSVPPAGVAAASGGNHGVAVAYAARELGYKARIFLPEISSPAKIAR